MKRFAYGCVATIMAINATEAGHVVEKRAIARAKPTTESSMKQPSSPLTEQQRAYYETQRVEVREAFGFDALLCARRTVDDHRDGDDVRAGLT